jgi:hypothetical protein
VNFSNTIPNLNLGDVVIKNFQTCMFAHLLGSSIFEEASMKYDPEKHHRRSIRLRGYDYSQPVGIL